MEKNMVNKLEYLYKDADLRRLDKNSDFVLKNRFNDLYSNFNIFEKDARHIFIHASFIYECNPKILRQLGKEVIIDPTISWAEGQLNDMENNKKICDIDLTDINNILKNIEAYSQKCTDITSGILNGNKTTPIVFEFDKQYFNLKPFIKFITLNLKKTNILNCYKYVHERTPVCVAFRPPRFKTLDIPVYKFEGECFNIWIAPIKTFGINFARWELINDISHIKNKDS